MENDRLARYGAATGIIFVILIVVGFGGLVLPNIPHTDASAQEWASYFTDHQNRIQTGVTVLGVGLFFFIWSLGSLRGVLAAAEGGNARLASIAYGGGLVSAAFLVVGAGAIAAAAFRPQEVDPNLTRALNDIGTLVGAPASGAFTALFAATAVAGYRHNALPAPVAGLSALAALLQPLGLGTAVTDSGVFAASGVLGGFVPFAAFVIGYLAISIARVRRPVVATRVT
jgi:hypothetical protein